MNELNFSKTLKDLNLQMHKVINKRNKEIGINMTPIQGMIIIALKETKELLCQKDLEQFVSCNKSTLSEILDTMEKNDLIKRVEDEFDTRKKVLLLTKKSQEVVNMILEDRVKIEESMCKGITKDEMKAFNKTLSKMLENLERM